MKKTDRPPRRPSAHSVALGLTILLSASLLLPRTAVGQTQTNFAVAPPPLGYPEYDGALTGLDQMGANPLWSATVGGLVTTLSAEDASFFGVGIFAAPRMALGPGAINVVISGLRLAGTAADLDMGVWAVDTQLVGELCVAELGPLRAIVFLGYDLNWSRAGFTMEDLPYMGTTNDIFVSVHTLLHGPVLGAQTPLAVHEDVLVTPFLVVRSLGGSSDPEPLVDLWSELDEPYDVERYWSTTFGIDALYLPWDISLSGLFQLARGSGDMDGTQSFLLTASYAL